VDKKTVKRILVTSAGGGASNNLMKGLRESSLPVFLVGTSIDPYYLARSRGDRNHLIPRVDSGEAYVEALARIVGEEGIDLVIPNNDLEVPAVSAARDRLGARTYLPAHESIGLCQDKLALTRHLAAHGIRVPETHPIGNPKQAEELFARFGHPDRLWCRMRKGGGSKGSLPVKNPDQVHFWVDYWTEMRGVPEDMFVLCEYLPGRDYAVQSLWHEGELIQAKTCERLDHLFGGIMPSGSSSTPRVALALEDPLINDLCVSTVRAVDPRATGLFCIDLKEDREGVPCVTEINIGRFFMITPLFNAVGRHNMAELYVRLAFGELPKIAPQERFGDIGSEETYLVREVDNEPEVLTADQIRSRYIDCQGAGISPRKVKGQR
jgi:carbamoyl-phosphate synthase large subunit